MPLGVAIAMSWDYDPATLPLTTLSNDAGMRYCVACYEIRTQCFRAKIITCYSLLGPAFNLSYHIATGISTMQITGWLAQRLDATL
jgi:hypothetical protein